MEIILINLSDINPIIRESNGFKELFDNIEEHDSVPIAKNYYFQNYTELFKNSYGVFRKLHQPAASPAAPHPGYSISEDRRDGDIQALLGAAEKILHIMRYWDLNPLPYKVLNYLYKNEGYILNLDKDLVKYFEEIIMISKTKKNDLCQDAARIGSLNLLKIAHENGCPWCSYTCAFAAANGHLNCLKYLHENGCPWDKNTCVYAANRGSLDCLIYAHENGCPWETTSRLNIYKNL